MGKVVCIVQARTTSARFPYKILTNINGRPMISHVLERAAAIHGVDQVVLAVPEGDVEAVKHLWPYYFGGQEDDVLGRYAACAEWYGADVIVRVTGDCPLLAPDLASEFLPRVKRYSLDVPVYLPMCYPYEHIPDGFDVEVFNMAALIKANKNANKFQREHVTTWLRENSNLTRKLDAPCYGGLKCSVDTYRDLNRVIRIMLELKSEKDFSSIATLDAWERAGFP